MSEVVNVLVDGFAHLGPLSYQVPPGMAAPVGHAVSVPFGKREAIGLILGPGRPEKATKPIIVVHGPRTTEVDLRTTQASFREDQAAANLVAARLAPRRHRSDPPVEPGPVALVHQHQFTYTPTGPRILLLHPPLIYGEQLAALEAVRILNARPGGQVLILCPSVLDVERVLNQFTSGAVRLDAKARSGEWTAFRDGRAPVGVGTRSAAWYSAETLAGIVVLDESNEGHREPTSPRQHARSVAAARATAHGAYLSLLSRNPSPAGLGSDVRVVPVTTAGNTWPRTRLEEAVTDTGRSVTAAPSTVEMVQKAAAEHRCLVVLSGNVRRLCVQCRANRTDNPTGPCPACGFEHVTQLGVDEPTARALFGEQILTTTAADLHKHRDAGLVVIPELTSLMTRPSLTPYDRVVELVLDACTAAGPDGTVLGLFSGEPHEVLSLLFIEHDQLTVAKNVYAAARRLTLPPFGRLARLQIWRKEPPDVSSWPGYVHGPIRVDNAWEVLIRYQQDSAQAIAGLFRQLRQQKTKFRYVID